MDTSHEADIDSPNGNDFTFTVRVRAVAHGGDIGDVKGEMRRPGHSRPHPAQRLSIYLGESVRAVQAADLDGDGNRDIIYPSSGGRIYAYSITVKAPRPSRLAFVGRRVDGLEQVRLPYYVDQLGYKVVDMTWPAISTSAIADIDDDGNPRSWRALSAATST